MKVINFPMSETPPILIGDISVYNANRSDLNNIRHFDFERFLSMGGSAIIMRAAVAADGLDYEFEYNLREVTRLGIPFTVYHYTKLWKNLDVQANLIKQVTDMIKDNPYWMKNTEFAQRYGYDCGVFLDIEANDGLTKTIFTANAQKLAIKVLNLTGFAPGIYTAPYFWENNTYRNDWAKTLPLWLAHWFTTTNPYVIPSVRPAIPSDWSEINNPEIPYIWQFRVMDNGRDWGSMGTTGFDVSFFVRSGGTTEAFKNVFGIEPYRQPTTPPPANTKLVKFAKCIVGTLNVRSGAGTNYPIVEKLTYEKVVEVLDEKLIDPNNTWIRIGYNQWTAMRYGGQNYMTYL